MTKKRLNSVQIIAVAFFFILAFLFVLNAKPYRVELGEEFLNPACFSFLQKGEYTMDVSYSGAGEGCEIVAYSDVTADSDNSHTKELARVRLDGKEGAVTMPLSLEQGTYRVIVSAICDGESSDCVTEIILQSDNIIHKDNYFLAILYFAAACILIFIFINIPYERYNRHLFLIAVGVAACIPILSHSLIWGYDLQFHIARIEGIYQALSAGDFPVRINPVQMDGYGSLSGTMYPQLFLYPFALLRFLGVSAILCYKLLIAVMNVGTAYSSFYSAKSITKSNRIGAWMSILYTFSMYRMCDVYVRAAVGESLAMLFLPLVIWGCYEILWGDRRWGILAAGMTGVLQSHVLSTEMCAVFLLLELVWWFVYLVVKKNSKKKIFSKDTAQRLWAGIKAVAITILINAGFLVPFLYFMRQNLQCFNVAPGVAKSVVYFSQMFMTLPHVDGVSKGDATTNGEMTLSVGLILLLGVVLFIVAMKRTERKNRKKEHYDGVGIHCTVYGIIALIMSSWLFPWEKIEGIDLISSMVSSLQFVWRFLGIASVFLCLVSAIAIEKIVEDGDRFRWVYGCAAALLLVSSGCLFDELAHKVMQETDPMTAESWTTSDHLYLYMGSEFLDYKRENAYLKTYSGEEALYENYMRRGTNISVEVTPMGDTEDYLVFSLYHFPGYEVRINGEKADIMAIDTLVACRMPMEHSLIEVSYVGKPFYLIGDAASLVCVIGIAIFIIADKTGLRRKRKGDMIVAEIK